METTMPQLGDLGGTFPPTFGPTRQGWFTVNVRDQNAVGAFQVYGPFNASIVPVSGELQFPGSGGSSPQLVVADVRIRLPADSKVRPRAIITEDTTGDAYEVVFIQAWTNAIDVYAVRKAADA